MAARVLRGQFPRRGRRQDHLHLVAISVDTEYIAAVAVAPRHGRGVRGAGRGGGGGGGDGYRNCPGRRLRRRGEWGLFSIGTKAVLGAAVVVAARIVTYCAWASPRPPRRDSSSRALAMIAWFEFRFAQSGSDSFTCYGIYISLRTKCVAIVNHSMDQSPRASHWQRRVFGFRREHTTLTPKVSAAKSTI